MSDDNVIKFDPAAKKPWITCKTGGKRCKHLNIIVNDTERVVYCEDCTSTLDSFQILCDIAESRRKGFYSLLELKRTRERIESLMVDERRTKARLRNARKRLAEKCHVGDDCPNVKVWRDKFFEMRRKASIRVDE